MAPPEEAIGKSQLASYRLRPVVMMTRTISLYLHYLSKGIAIHLSDAWDRQNEPQDRLLAELTDQYHSSVDDDQLKVA